MVPARLVLALVLVAGSLGGTAGASRMDRSVTSPGRVIGLARSGLSVAFVSAQVGNDDCAHVELWSLISRGVYRMGTKGAGLCIEGPSTGAGVTGVAVAGSRTLWVEYAGGNERDYVLFTATRTSRKPLELELETVDVDATPPIVVGVGSEAVLPYSVGRSVRVLNDRGRRVYTWQAPARVTNTTAYDRQVAVFVEGGRCFILSPGGAVQQTYTFPRGAVQEFALARIGLLVQLPGSRVQVLRNGAVVKELTLPAGARMRDYAENILLYSVGSQVRGRKVASGGDALIRTAGAQAPLARLEHNGMSYAIGKRVYSVAMVNVQAAFR
jgi:hypothetical protein